MAGRVFLVYKSSTLESRRRHGKRRPGNATISARLKSAHDQHCEALESFQTRLKRLGIKVRLVRRNGARIPDLDKNDLVISFGGDGTFMYASHLLKNTPLLGINSAPDTSVGYFCGYHAEQPELDDALPRIVNGEVKPRPLNRLDLVIGGKVLGAPVLNDVLITEKNPAVTSRYLLQYKGKSQYQKSSGIWISTAWGSTAAFSSAGGRPFRNANVFRFLVRELYDKKRGSITAGIGRDRTDLCITSAMDDGRIYLDGGFRELAFGMGTTLSFTPHKYPLQAILPNNFGKKR